METVSVSALLPEGARKPLDHNAVELIARGLVIPSREGSQRLAIDLLKAQRLVQEIKQSHQEDIADQIEKLATEKGSETLRLVAAHIRRFPI